MHRRATFLQRRARALQSSRSVSSTADVVVVGGGVAGVATARALAMRGASVVLLEQNSLTSGTTWHAAGLLGTLKGSPMMCSLARYGNETYRAMNDEAGNSMVGWVNTGSMGIARCGDSMEQLVRAQQMAHGIGHTHHRVVTPAEIAELHPFLELEGIVGGVFSPEDGICNPADVTMAMAKEARAYGAEIAERTEVIGFELDESGRRVVAVETKGGDRIVCNSAVLCGGAWTKELSKRAFGENRIAVAMMPHQYAIFDRTEGVGGHLPVTRDILHKYYLKPEVGGFMVGVFEGSPLEHHPEHVRARNADTEPMPADAEHELFDESFDKAGQWLEAAMEDVPALTQVGIKQWLHGPDTHSTDHHPLIGLLPKTDNVYAATGFNSQGIQCGPAAGLSLAEMILDGGAHSLGCDLSGADPSRIFGELCDDSSWVESRAAEGYGKTYSIHYPNEFFESARAKRLSPLHSQLVERGAAFTETYGWERPAYFNSSHGGEAAEPSEWLDPMVNSPALSEFSFDRSQACYFEHERRECLAARNSAACFDLSSFGKLKVQGDGSLQLLQQAMTAEMDKTNGSITYSLFCNERGGILGDLTVARLASDEFYIVTLANQPQKVADHLARVARKLGLAESTTIQDVTEANSVIAINGPRAREILSPLSSASLDNEHFAPGSAKHCSVAGIDLLALRVSFAGELGWELHCPSNNAEKLYQQLMASDSELLPAGNFALLNALRMEKGFVHYGADISSAETPLEAGLGFACKLKPGQPDFEGKQAIEAQKQAGFHKRLVSLRAPPAVESFSLFGHEQELLYRDGSLVGSITSGAHSYTLACEIGLGYVHGPARVPNKWLKEGSYEVSVPTRDKDNTVRVKRFPVEISTKCLLDPKGLRVLGGQTAV